MKAKLLCIIFWLCFLFSSFANDNQLIRKLYLDVLKVPPMPTELEYYETEFTDSYKAAVDKLIKKEDINYNKYLSNDYKLEKIKLTFLEKVNIIYYYSGFKSATIVNFSDMKKAILKIIEFSELECETISEKFDYFSIRLMARKLNVSEFNFLYKKYNNLIKMKTENESLYIIFLDIMNFDDCNYR